MSSVRYPCRRLSPGIAALVALLCMFLLVSNARAVVYNVGPGQTYAEINDVPWENLAAGDTVNIYWRSTAYKSKWVITAAGTPSQPILIHGVPSGGNLPVIDGNAATTRLQLSYWNDERAIINFGHSTIPADGVPKYVTIENLEIKDARPPFGYTCDEGTAKVYPNMAASIWIVAGENITVRNCILDNNGNGFMTFSDDTVQTKNILVEGCYLYDNGNDASIYEHNSYCETLGITYQYNHYGPLRTNCPGNNLKDRSAGLVIRYNWIQDGNRQCDIVDPEDSGVLGNDPSYNTNFIYGNYLVEGMSGNRQVIHFGGDMGGVYRKKGYFYNNTIVSTRTDATTVVRESGGPSSVFDCRNNIIYTTSAGSTIEISNDSDGVVNMTHNWLKPGYLLAGGSGGTVNDDGTSVTGTAPGFTNEGAQDYTITSSSPCKNAGTSLHADAIAAGHYLYYQYVKHQTYETRTNDGQIDIGAYEVPGGQVPDLVITTSSLPNGQVTIAYSQALQATGGQPPYSWSVSGGSLPAGLSITSAGVISGTPTASGVSSFTARVQDSQGTPDVATNALSITVQLLPVQIAGPSFMRSAQQNVFYRQQLTGAQGQAPYTWSVNGGSLPAGLSLGASTGIISGTPTALGTSNFTIKIQDSQASPDSTTKAFSIAVVAASGNTYWVAASGGSDSYPGSSSQPWATIQHGIDTIANGDRILVAAGSYNGLRITNSGSSGAVKAVMSETVGAATLNHPGTGAAYNSNVEIIGVSGTPVSYWTVDGFTIDGVNKTYRLAYLDYTNHVSVQNCVGLQSSTTGFFARYSDYVLFDGNTVHDCAGSGIFGQSSADNGTIRGNTIYATTSCGVKLNGYTYDTGDGIMSNWLVEKNKIYGNQTAVFLDGVETSSYKNNLMYNNSGKQFSMVSIDGAVTPRNSRILNNTVVAPSTSYYCVFIFNEYAHPAGVGNVCNNNILYHYSTAVNRGSFCIDTAIDTQFTSDYNVVMDGFGFDDNATYCNFATWKSTHNHDTHSLQAADTALFVNAGANDFHLKAGSPALNAGTTLADVPTDIDGVTRPQGGAYDIGCYEGAGGALAITTTSLPADTINVAYNQTLAATGGTSPYTWAISSGSLPTGLSLVAATGVISGTPTAAGTSNFTARVTDNVSATATQALSIVINSAPSITTSSLPNGQLSVAYNQTLAASGGTTPLTWAISSGSLPAGLSLTASTGAITGTPTATGTSNFTARVTDNVGATATKALSIVVTGAVLTITTSSLPADTVGIVYNQTLTASGGSTPYTWAIASGSLPAGLSLNTSTGAITGTPTTAGTSSFTARVTDNVAATATKALSIAINAAPSITTASLPGGTVGAAYNQTLAATGGTTPLTWSISSGSLPAGLSLAAGTGAITGTPTTSGTSSFTARVTDNVGATATKALSIVVIAPLTITTTTLSSGTVGIAYNQTLAATGGTTPYTWAIASGSLPSGLSLVASTGAITGTPSAVGTSNFTARVTDNVAATATKALSIIVNSASGDPTYWQASSDTQSQTTSTTYQNKVTLTFTPTAVDDYIIIGYAEHQSTGYGSSTIQMTVDGVVEGLQPRRTRGSDWFPLCSVKAATLSAAQHTVTIDYAATGTDAVNIRRARVVAMRKAALEWFTVSSDNLQTITTTPTTFATLNFTPASVGDYLLIYSAELYTLYGNTATVTAQLDGATIQTCPMMSKGYTNEAAPLATFAMANLSAAAHAMTIQASIASGTSSIGRCRMAAVRLTGGRFANYSYTASDGESTTTSTTLVEKVSRTWTPASTGNWLALMSASTTQSAIWYSCDAQMLFNASAVSDNLQVIMDTSEYMSTAGMGVLNVTGGSSTMASDYCTNSATYAAKIKYAHLMMLPLDSGGAPLSITTSSLPADTVGVAYNQTLAATGGTTPYTWSLQSGSLPAGLSLVAGTGAITGTPTAAGTSNFTAKVTDNVSATATQALSIVINAAVSITTASLPADTINVGYNQTLSATGGTGSLTWSLNAGSLPTGLSLTSGGAITGTPTAAGTSSFTVKATDTVTASATKALSIVVNAAVSITTSSLPADTVGIAYNQTMAATGGTGALTWSISSGSLPAGLSLVAASGAITGTPTSAGTSNFTAMATDTLGANGTKALSIVVNAPVSITISSLPADTVNIAYNQTLSATGGTGSLTWSLNAGSLPTGLSLTSGGSITGTPTAAGTSSFTVKATDTLTASATKALSIVVNAAPTITTSSLPADTINIAYNQTLAATGGTSPLSWAISSGSLPTGLTIVAGTGAITGTPTAAGTSSFTARVTDNVGATATQALSIVVNAAPSITTSSLPNGNVGASYNQTLVSTGGTSPITWAISSGSLPSGLTLVASTGAITGTPTASGTSNFTARVTDNVGATATKALSIVVTSTLAITTSSLPATTVGASYNQTLAATGGVTPYTWAISAGSLPAGLSLVAGTGAITGTPTAAGTSNFTARVTDNFSATATKALSIVVNAAVTITTASLPADTINVAYNQTLAATGGTGALTWSISSGTLATGLSLNSSTGAITGTPTASGTSNFTARATDTVNATGTKALSIVINAAPSITTSSLPGATVGTAYNQTMAATGGTAPLTWSIQSGSLPAGLSLNSSTGAITGTPTASGTSNFTAKVTDNVAATASKALSIVVTSGGTSATYQYVSSDTETSTTSTNYVNKATITFTPSASDSWVVFAFAEIKNSSTSYLTGIRLTIDGSVAQDSTIAPKATNDYQSFAGMKVVTLSSASHTCNVDYRSSNASGTAYIRNARIVAIRKASLELYSGDGGDSGSDLTTTMTDYATASWTCPAATDYLAIWSAEWYASTSSYSTTIEGHIDGGAVDATTVYTNNTGNYYSFLATKTFSADANTAHSISTAAMKQSSSTGTHHILRARCTAFNLTTGRFSGFVMNRDGTESTTTSTSWQQKLTTNVAVSTAQDWLVLCTWRLANSSTSYSSETQVQLDNATTEADTMRRPSNASDYFGCACVDVRNLSSGTRVFDVDYRTSNSSGTAKIKNVHFEALPL